MAGRGAGKGRKGEERKRKLRGREGERRDERCI